MVMTHNNPYLSSSDLDSFCNFCKFRTKFCNNLQECNLIKVNAVLGAIPFGMVNHSNNYNYIRCDFDSHVGIIDNLNNKVFLDW